MVQTARGRERSVLPAIGLGLGRLVLEYLDVRFTPRKRSNALHLPALALFLLGAHRVALRPARLPCKAHGMAVTIRLLRTSTERSPLSKPIDICALGFVVPAGRARSRCGYVESAW